MAWFWIVLGLLAVRIDYLDPPIVLSDVRANVGWRH